MTIISGTADHRFPSEISYFCVDLHYCCLKYAKISTSFPVIRSSYFLKYDAQIAANGVSGVYISKSFRGGMPPDPPRMSHAFGARLHDHSHDAGFATGGGGGLTPPNLSNPSYKVFNPTKISFHPSYFV